MLKPEQVPIENLLLDPNNPRLAMNFKNIEAIDSSEIKKYQPTLERQFGLRPPKDSSQDEVDRLIEDSDSELEDDFSISSLMASIREMGFLPIENVQVRRIEGSDKFVVIEGNRRIASIKRILQEHEDPTKRAKHPLSEEIIKTLEQVKVMVLQEDDDEETAQKNIDLMLGLRHLEGHLDWELLPRARNIYDEYMKRSTEPFHYDTEVTGKVAAVIGQKKTDVKRLIRAYVVYTQLGTHYPVLPKHFSLILAGAENPNLRAYKYFEVNEQDFSLEGDSIEKFNTICEFEDRETQEINIVRDPKQFKKLGTIFKDSKRHKDSMIKELASGLFAEIEIRQIELEDAYSELLAAKKRKNWVKDIGKLLDRKNNDSALDYENYIGEGSERELAIEVEALLGDLVAGVKRHRWRGQS